LTWGDSETNIPTAPAFGHTHGVQPVFWCTLAAQAADRLSTMPKRWYLPLVVLFLLMAGCGTSMNPGSVPTTGLPSSTNASTTVPSTAPPVTTGVPSTTTTSMVTPRATASVQITRDGQVVWQTGEPLNDAYYCCYPPSPDGVDRSGSAGCSGSTANGVPGLYANGRLC
jgi:hypothetical protein